MRHHLISSVLKNQALFLPTVLPRRCCAVAHDVVVVQVSLPAAQVDGDRPFLALGQLRRSDLGKLLFNL